MPPDPELMLVVDAPPELPMLEAPEDALLPILTVPADPEEIVIEPLVVPDEITTSPEVPVTAAVMPPVPEASANEEVVELLPTVVVLPAAD